MSSFCSMPWLAGWFLLKEIIKPTSVFYPICLKKYMKKQDKHLRCDLFCESCVIIHHSLLKVDIRHFARNLGKVLTELWKDKKTKENMKENLFQVIANELCKLPKQRTHEKSNRLFWELGVVPKTDDKIYISIGIGKYIITFHLFSVLHQRRSCCWKYRKWGSHLKNRYHYAKLVKNLRIHFWISPYCTLLFSRKKNLKFLK